MSRKGEGSGQSGGALTTLSPALTPLGILPLLTTKCMIPRLAIILFSM